MPIDVIITDPRAPLPVGYRTRGAIGRVNAVIMAPRGGLYRLPCDWVAPCPGPEDMQARTDARRIRRVGRALSWVALVAVALVLTGCEGVPPFVMVAVGFCGVALAIALWVFFSIAWDVWQGRRDLARLRKVYTPGEYVLGRSVDES